jgi:outer membrane protein assembly factor BamE (lipoprotein component of BamABCDE complex)
MTIGVTGGRGPGRGLTLYGWLVLSFTLVIAACTPIFSNHGYLPTDEDLAVLQVGVDTRESVATTIGQPAASGLLGDEAWFYVQSRWRTVGAAQPVEIDRQVLAISFDPDGTVANIERFGLEKGQIVPLSRRVTTTNIRGKGVLAQVFGNIGKLNTENLFK